MAITQTAANVAVTSDTITTLVQVGETVTQGQPGYRNTSDQKYYQCDANDTAAKAVCAGIFMTPATAAGYALLATDGQVNLGATLTVGMPHVLSTTKGGIDEVGSLASSSYVTTIGIAITAALFDIQIHVSGVQKP